MEITLTIDGKEIKAEEGTNLLSVALKNKINIPNLCYNENLEPYGECRLCMVEISAHNRTRLVAACCYPVENGLIVKTQTDRINHNRKVLVELLLARSPSGTHVELAKDYGIETTPYKPVPNLAYACTLCGLCVRYCDEIKGDHLVTFMGRGIDRTVELLPGSTEMCQTCKKCFEICDAGGIAYIVDHSAGSIE